MQRYRFFVFCLACLLLAGCSSTRPIKGPASQYLPYPVDLPGYLIEKDNLGLERLVEQTPVRVLPEDSAYINFDNSGYSYTTEPQNGVYLRLAFWVTIHPSTSSAKSFFRSSSAEQETKDRLYAIMPSAVQDTIEKVSPVALSSHSCQEAALYKIPSHVVFTPDLYLYAACRVDNAVVLLWAYTADNYDGNNTPIPDEVMADQMSGWLDLALARIKP